MSIVRLANLGFVCLFASACTVVLQPAPNQPAVNQPERAPTATEADADVGIVEPGPVRRPTRQAPRRRPSDREPEPEPSPRRYEPESPSPRPSVRENRMSLGIPPGHRDNQTGQEPDFQVCGKTGGGGEGLQLGGEPIFILNPKQRLENDVEDFLAENQRNHRADSNTRQ